MIKLSDLKKDTYRTGEIAELLGVSIGTIHYWLEAGKIEYYTLPNSNHRRITKEHLINYLDANGLYVDDMTNTRQDVIYVRVSTNEQESRGDLNRQKQNVKTLRYA